MAGARFLIVNADDFGLSSGVNRGVVHAHDHGIVTSASLMVRRPAAVEAAALGQARPRLSLGLHVDLGEWAYRDGAWAPLYQVVMEDSRAIAEEVARQMEAFRRLVGADPTHLDTHQHVHREEPVRSVLLDVARRFGVPLRGCSAQIQYCGAFYGQTAKGEPLPNAITVEALLDILLTLPTGITELSCHPGLGNDLDTMYRSERSQELPVLCDPRVRATMDALDIRLRSFRDIGPVG